MIEAILSICILSILPIVICLIFLICIGDELADIKSAIEKIEKENKAKSFREALERRCRR